ncbi:MAG: hypothetical protein GWN00_31610, partial [Aliifodinibius sp.]|nr:hypothetical protein [candidate division Zixibacteria bacterium]NIT60588.1 hypothetical protein [Fodinibius sp.]NIV15299.1 hypothetical protein [Fodinibius sp.]NIY29170.1 hypothetical protein [Fodinibius sp.]
VSRNRQDNLIFDLSADGSSDSVEEARVFDVSIDGKNVIDNLNLEDD